MNRDQVRPGQLTAPHRFEVLVGVDGAVTVNGERLEAAAAHAHTAALGVLQRAATDRGEPVEAVILAQPHGYAAMIEVSPDGSSRLLARL